jgi:hypothetical protein
VACLVYWYVREARASRSARGAPHPARATSGPTWRPHSRCWGCTTSFPSTCGQRSSSVRLQVCGWLRCAACGCLTSTSCAASCIGGSVPGAAAQDGDVTQRHTETGDTCRAASSARGVASSRDVAHQRVGPAAGTVDAGAGDASGQGQGRRSACGFSVPRPAVLLRVAAHRVRDRRQGRPGTAAARLRHAFAKTTLDTYGHLWPDSDDGTRAAVDAALGPGLADYLRTRALA